MLQKAEKIYDFNFHVVRFSAIVSNPAKPGKVK